MGDHCVLMVDRLLTGSALEDEIAKDRLDQIANLENKEDSTDSSSDRTHSSPSKSVQCRICHDEDEDSNMDTPCSCSGSLKYAHRKCVQRWCNEKGDTICEICRQQFKPNYTAPRRLFHNGGIPMGFSGNWGIYGIDLHNPHFILSAAEDHGFPAPNFEDYSAHSPRSLICCRIIAILFMLLLFLRHTLPIILSGATNYSPTVFMLPIIRTIGIVLPVYIMVKAFISFQRRRRLQDPRFSVATSDEETELPQPPLVAVH